MQSGLDRRSGHLLLAGVLLIFAWAKQAAAAEDTSASDLVELSLAELMDVEITSVSKRSEKKSTAAAAIFVLTNEDIRRSGATNIPDALRLVPGVNVAQIDSNKWSVTVRGAAGRFATKLLVLIDGRSVYTPFFSGVYWEANDVMLEDVERIEVVRGPGGTLWGANAVNGVINIITKRAEDTQGGLLSVGGGTEERGFGALRYGGRVGDVGHYRAYGKFFSRDKGGTFVQNDPALGSDDGANDDWWMGQGGFRIDLDANERDALTIQGDVYTNSASTTTDLLYFGGVPVRRVDSTTDYTGWNIGTRWNRRLSDTSDLQLKFYYDSYHVDDVTLEERRHTIDLEFQHRFEVGGRQEFVWGVGYRLTVDDFDGTAFVSLDPDNRDLNLFSTFIQDQIAITDRLKLTIGSKFEHNDYTGLEVQPSARIAWSVNERHTLWGAVSRAVRTPSRTDRDVRINFFTSASTPGAFVVVFGDDDFDSEEVLAYELGYRVALSENLVVDIAGFYNDYKDLRFGEAGAPFLETDPSPDHTVIPFFIVNGGGGETFGAEVTVDYQLKPWWSIQASYSFLEVDFETPQNGSSSNGDAPEQQFVLTNRFNLPRNIEIDTILRYVDRLPAIDIDDYVTLDARIAWRPTEDLELALVGRNLFQSEHPEFRPTVIHTVPTEVQRGVYGKVTWRF